MIIYALISRTKDGMALSATTDCSDESNCDIKESKKYLKLVSKKANQFPDRCTVRLLDHNIHFVSCLGVTYLALCDTLYPTVLAFSFLNELMREFVTKYETVRVNLARRPYTFIEFDSFIHKARHRYNKPQSLTTRVNLTELSHEIKLHPPHHLTQADIEPARNGFYMPQLGVGPPPHLEPLTRTAIITIVPTSMFALVGFYRGFSALSSSSIEEYDGPTPVHGLIYLVESLLRLLQVYLLLHQSRYRMLESWAAVTLLLACVWSVWDLRDTTQRTLHILSAIASHVATVRRTLQVKLPNYHV